jgi:methyl-accepting chemotaxis protein
MNRTTGPATKEWNAMANGSGARGVGLATKMILFLAAVLLPLALVTWTIAVQSLRRNLTEEFTSKGSAIANSLATTAVDMISTRDASTVQAFVDQFASISGVAYVMVYDAHKTLIAHTFSPLVPAGLLELNVVSGSAAQQIHEIHYADPVTGTERQIIDIGVPVLAGQLGTVRVGMDKAVINAAAMQAGAFLFMAFAGAAILAVGAGVVFARRITRPVGELVTAARRVGQGNLSQLVPVKSSDEIGQLTQTINDTIVRLRSQVTTETERDEERHRREELQRNIARFLDTVNLVAQGDLTRRGEVTADILGNVVDAINVMVGEIGTMIAEVREAALQVASGANDMIDVMAQMSTGARTQSREAMGVSQAVEELTASVRQVAASAEASAAAAREGLEAAQQGEQAVGNSLAGMQRIRVEVQAIAKKIKRLGDRSLEISEILDTIEDISAQTNLLAVNAAIEAAGAGEGGLRFSIVADEIRKLAERSTKATKDIATLIQNVQVETQELVVVMEQGTQEVEAGYRVTVEAGESLKQIGGVSQRSAALAEDISLATRQQVRGAESVMTAVQAIAAVAVQTEQAVVMTRKTTNELVRLAEELRSNLSRFKLPEQRPAAPVEALATAS